MTNRGESIPLRMHILEYLMMLRLINPVVRPKNIQKLLALSVLRKINKSWRFIIHHVAEIDSSAFTGNELNVESLPVLSPSKSTPTSTKSNPTDKKDKDKPINTSKFMDSQPQLLGKNVELGLGNEISGNNKGIGGAKETLTKKNRDLLDEPNINTNSNDSITTIQRLVLTLRDLQRKGYLNAEEKEILLRSIFDKVTNGETAYIESSFLHFLNNELENEHGEVKINFEKFAEVCKFVLLQKSML
jgi:hypothetical protein